VLEFFEGEPGVNPLEVYFRVLSYEVLN